MTSNASPVVWSRAAANDLARGLLTPLTWSILSRSAERAVRSHYSAWGVTLPAGAPIWRRIQGRAYLNTTRADGRRPGRGRRRGRARPPAGGCSAAALSAARTLRCASRSSWPPPGLRPQQQWWERVQTMQWRQATVLQVMEEIEPHAEAVLTARDYLTTGLGAGRRQLTRWVAEWQPDSSSNVFDDLFAGLDGREGWAQYRYDLQSADRGRAARSSHRGLPRPARRPLRNRPVPQSPNHPARYPTAHFAKPSTPSSRPTPAGPTSRWRRPAHAGPRRRRRCWHAWPCG